MIEWFIKKNLFKNENHAIWFMCSMGFLIIIFSGYYYPIYPYIFIIAPIIIHIPPFITAIVKYKKGELDHLYSRDCIWFNFLIIIIYLIPFLFYINLIKNKFIL